MKRNTRNLLIRAAFYFFTPLLAGCSTVVRNKANEQECLDSNHNALNALTLSFKETFDTTLHTGAIAIDKDFNTELDVLMNKAFATTDFIQDPFNTTLNKFNVTEQQAIAANKTADKAYDALLKAVQSSTYRIKRNPNSILVKDDRKSLIMLNPTWCTPIIKAATVAAYTAQAAANAACATLDAAYTIQATIRNPLIRAIVTAHGHGTTPNIITDNKRVAKVMKHAYNTCSRVLYSVYRTANVCRYTTAQPYNDYPDFNTVHATNVANIHTAIQVANNAVARIKIIAKKIPTDKNQQRFYETNKQKRSNHKHNTMPKEKRTKRSSTS